MRTFPRLQPSRTFTLATLGLGLLAIAGLALAATTIACLVVDELRPELGRVLEVWPMWVVSVAGLAAGGAGAMGMRDAASRGRTTSQAQPVAPPDRVETP